MDNTILIEGTVKWFSTEKGFGFITNQGQIDYYFTIRDVIGAKIPTNGSLVQFQSHRNSKGLQAKSIKILSQVEESGRYVICVFCKKQMVPRIVFFKGSPDYSICPFCGKRHQSFMGILRSLVLALFSN